jgi:hypothetical protein
MIFNVLKIIDCFLVISYKFFIFYLKMFKIHVHNKTSIPFFYIVIQIMHISRLLNQHKKLKTFYYWLTFLNL